MPMTTAPAVDLSPAAMQLRGVRASAERWTVLGRLVRQVERLGQIAATIDAEGKRTSAKVDAAIEFERGIDIVTRTVEQQIAALTSELLQVELIIRKRKDGRT